MQAAVAALEFIGQHINAVVMTADHNQGVIELLVRAEQAHAHALLDFMTFQLLGNLQDPIGSHQGGNDACAALEGHGDQSSLHATENDPHEFFQPQFGRHFAAEHRLHLGNAGTWYPL